MVGLTAGSIFKRWWHILCTMSGTLRSNVPASAHALKRGHFRFAQLNGRSVVYSMYKQMHNDQTSTGLHAYVVPW